MTRGAAVVLVPLFTAVRTRASGALGVDLDLSTSAVYPEPDFTDISFFLTKAFKFFIREFLWCLLIYIAAVSEKRVLSSSEKSAAWTFNFAHELAPGQSLCPHPLFFKHPVGSPACLCFA